MYREPGHDDLADLLDHLGNRAGTVLHSQGRVVHPVLLPALHQLNQAVRTDPSTRPPSKGVGGKVPSSVTSTHLLVSRQEPAIGASDLIRPIFSPSNLGPSTVAVGPG